MVCLRNSLLHAVPGNSCGNDWFAVAAVQPIDLARARIVARETFGETPAMC
jgi:hypothetical protein